VAELSQFDWCLGKRGIAELLGMSEHTVKNYLFHIFDELGISNRVELVLIRGDQPEGSPMVTPCDDRTAVR
jgi:hypothetical protein